MHVTTYQTAPMPDNGTSNARPDGVANVTINAQPGPISVDAQGNVTHRGVRGLNTADFKAEPSGYLATARTREGAPSMGGVQASDIISVDGMEMRVDMAEKLGIVARDATGRYAEVRGGAEAAKAEAPQEAAVDDAQGFADAAVEAELGQLCQSVSPGLQIGALQDVIKEGEISPLTLQRASSEAGVEPDALAAQAGKMMEHFRVQAVSAVVGYGSSDPEGFFDWARESDRKGLNAAMNTHGLERSTRGYEPLYRQYVETMADHDPASVLEAEFGGGITARKEGKGVVLSIPGHGEMSYRSALKAGLIRVRGA